jgi:hypothetical protein
MILVVDVRARVVGLVIVRWLLLAVGVGLATLAFVHLVEVKKVTVHSEPWWWLGLIGVILTLLGLGSPRSSCSERAGGSPRAGS